MTSLWYVRIPNLWILNNIYNLSSLERSGDAALSLLLIWLFNQNMSLYEIAKEYSIDCL